MCYSMCSSSIKDMDTDLKSVWYSHIHDRPMDCKASSCVVSYMTELHNIYHNDIFFQSKYTIDVHPVGCSRCDQRNSLKCSGRTAEKVYVLPRLKTNQQPC